MIAPFMPDGEKLAAIRAALPAVGAGIYLDTPAAGPVPAEVAAAMAEIAEWELRTGRGGRDRRREVEGRLDEAGAAVAACLTVDLDRVLLAHGIEEAARLLAGPGADLTVWPAALDPAATQASVERLADGLAAGRIAAAVVPLITDTGLRLAVDELAAAARAGGGRLVVDVSYAAGAVTVDPDAIGAHLIVRSDAWLLGPQGLAAIVRRPDSSEPPVLAEPAPETFHLPSVVGLARACGWLSMYVGLPWAIDRAGVAASRMVTRLRAIPRVELMGEGPVITFRIAGWTADAALDELGGRVFLVASAVPGLDAIRIGPGCWTTDEEVDRVADAVALIAAHTPATVPARRRLAILGQD